jgi:uncharacterized protein YozE (UPF0346 family)
MNLVLKNDGGFLKVGYLYELLPEQANLFAPVGGNRSINSVNSNKILKNYLKNGYFKIPIVINENFEIIDGQHRLDAWVEFCTKFPQNKFNLLFMVVPGYTIKEAQKLNAIPPKKWSILDYIESYRGENQNYMIISDFMEKYGFGAVASVLLLSGKINRLYSQDYTNFRNGQFVIDPVNIDSAHIIADVIVNELNAFPNHKSDRFISAYMKLHTMERYDHARFLTNWDSFWRDELAGRNSESSFFQGLVEIHNGKVTKGRISTTKKKRVELAVAEEA